MTSFLSNSCTFYLPVPVSQIWALASALRLMFTAIAQLPIG